MLISPGTHSKCRWSQPPRPLSAQVWEMSLSPAAFQLEELSLNTSYQAYRDWAIRLPDMQTPQQRLKNLLQAYAHHEDESVEIIRTRLGKILSGELGLLREVHCLETLLIAHAHRLRSLIQNAYEFGAVVLHKPEADTNLLIYFVQSDSMSLRFDEILPLMEKKLQEGWRLGIQIHNHPFFPDRDPHRIGGYTAPGEADIQTFKEWIHKYELRSAYITNGVYSFEMHSPMTTESFSCKTELEDL